jgi:2-polyprenyl-3-methyl-5-hydroxy-6-metoxy-1,4-benzoquinol methylase
MTVTDTIDQARVEAFAERVLGVYRDGMVGCMIDLGHRTGLLEALAAGPATSPELAARAWLVERYVREWLGALVTAGIVHHDAGTYTLPAEHAACLTGGGAGNMAPLAQINTLLARYVGEVAAAFRDGGGVPYEAYKPDFTGVMDAASRNVFDEVLPDGYVTLVPELGERLAAGGRVADIGCGTGHALVVLALAYPDCTFVGVDFSADAVEEARAEAAAEGLDNVTFEVRDAAEFTTDEPFDVVVSFDAIHDQARPATVLARIHAALAPGGLYLMTEPAVSSDLDENVANPIAPWMYGVSTLHCMTVSLAQDGAGLGTAWGEQVARRMLADAGFADIDVQRVPEDPINAVFVARKRA